MNPHSNHDHGHHNHGHPHHHHPHDGHDHDHMVTVSLGDLSKKVEKGTYTVTEIKGWFNVPQGDALEVADDGKLTPLADDGSFTIKHDVKFFACPRVATSS